MSTSGHEDEAADAATETAEEKTLRIMGERNKRMNSEKSVHNGRNFAVRETDVFVSTYPKCGTTWVTAICHALRTRGQAEFQSFGEITEVVPWDILAMDCDQDLNADHVAEPRVFKSHETWGDIAKGGRYIYVCRNPADSLVSFYHFLPGFAHCADGTLTIEGFTRAIFAGLSNSGTIWRHYVDWIQAALAMPDKILVLTFEDLKRDHKKEIRRIAAFLEIPDVDDALIERVYQVTCFEYMKSHDSQFNDHFVFNKVKDRMGLGGFEIATSKVKAGSSGRGKTELSPNIISLLEQKWAECILPNLGVNSYEEFVNTIIHGKLHQTHATNV